MAHFAKLDQHNKVLEVITVDNNVLLDENGNENEELGRIFCENIDMKYNWRQTSYNSTFRKHYAGVGYTFDEELNAFIPPKSYDSWILNEETCVWESPIGPAPERTEEQITNRFFYQWDESIHQADNTKGWVLIEKPQ